MNILHIATPTNVVLQRLAGDWLAVEQQVKLMVKQHHSRRETTGQKYCKENAARLN